MAVEVIGEEEEEEEEMELNMESSGLIKEEDLIPCSCLNSLVEREVVPPVPRPRNFLRKCFKRPELNLSVPEEFMTDDEYWTDMVYDTYCIHRLLERLPIIRRAAAAGHFSHWDEVIMVNKYFKDVLVAYPCLTLIDDFIPWKWKSHYKTVQSSEEECEMVQYICVGGFCHRRGFPYVDLTTVENEWDLAVKEACSNFAYWKFLLQCIMDGGKKYGKEEYVIWKMYALIMWYVNKW